MTYLDAEYRRLVVAERIAERGEKGLKESAPLVQAPKEKVTKLKPSKKVVTSPPSLKTPKKRSRPRKPKSDEPLAYCTYCDQPMSRNGIYCSQSCAGKHRAIKNQEAGVGKPRKPGAGRKRTYVPVQKNCLQCGNVFETCSHKPNQIYCNRFCSSRRSRARLLKQNSLPLVRNDFKNLSTLTLVI